jgi:hypothetical protein
MSDIPPPPNSQENATSARPRWIKRRILRLPMWAWLLVSFVILGAVSTSGTDEQDSTSFKKESAIPTEPSTAEPAKDAAPDTATVATEPVTTTSSKISTTIPKTPSSSKAPSNNPATPSTSKAPSTAAPSPTTAQTTETVSQKNARRSAESYLKYSAFSRSGLIDQLLFEGFSQADAEYAVSVISVDWNEQSFKSAQSYLRYSAFSRSGLIDQLLYEGFSQDQATYGVDRANPDWNEQAYKSAQSYLRYSSFSRSGLISQLLYEGFSQDQAEYGVNMVGL